MRTVVANDSFKKQSMLCHVYEKVSILTIKSLLLQGTCSHEHAAVKQYICGHFTAEILTAVYQKVGLDIRA